MPLPKKYNFIPENQLNTEIGDEVGYTVTITKSHFLYFSKFVVNMYELENKVIRLYADPEKKSIAFTEVKGGNLDILKNVRVMKKNILSGAVVISIAPILRKIGITKDMLPIKNIPVTEYSDSLIETKLQVIDIGKFLKKEHE